MENSNRRYFMVKAGHKGDGNLVYDNLVAKGRIGLGWSDVDLSNKEESIQMVREVYEKGVAPQTWGRKAWVIRRFQNMKPGDRVLFRVGQKVYVGEVVTESILHEDAAKGVDLANQREVNFYQKNGEAWGYNIGQLPSSVQHQLGRGSRGLAVKDITSVINGLTFDFWNNPSGLGEVYNQGVEEYRRRCVQAVKAALQGRSGHTSVKPGGIEFEALIQVFLQTIGFEVERQATHSLPRGSDVDLIASKLDTFMGDVRLFVQVKNHKGRSGMEALRQLQNAYDELSRRSEVQDGDKWIIVTSGDQDEELRKEVELRYPSVHVVDGDSLAEWVLDEGYRLSDEIKQKLGLLPGPVTTVVY